MKAVNPGGELLGFRADSQTILDVDSPDDQNLVLDLDLTRDLCREIAFVQLDTARLQRASQGTGQSPAGRGDDVVEGRSAWREALGIDAVVFGDLGMDSKQSRFFLCG